MWSAPTAVARRLMPCSVSTDATLDDAYLAIFKTWPPSWSVQ